MNSFQGSIAAFILRGFAAFVRVLPLWAALFLGRRIGDIAAWVSPRQRRLVMGHLKVAFGRTHSYAQLKIIRRDFYRCSGQSIVELARLPLIAKHGYAQVVDVHGRAHVDAAMKKGKGCIFLAIHSGNWELSNIIGGMCGYPYNMVANDLHNINKVGEFLNELRRSAGCRIIHPGIGGREIIRCLKNNEIVTLVADQGGSDGVRVPFFGRDAFMSSGAVRLALKYDVPIILVNIHRTAHGRHRLEAVPFDLDRTGDADRDIAENLGRMMCQYEAWVAAHPAEYVWFYKTWKYAKDRTALILDDGRVGHLRQAQAVARAYMLACKEKGLTTRVETVRIDFRRDLAASLLSFVSGGDILHAGADLDVLKAYLEPECLSALQRLRPDMVISCGARNTAVNWWVARESRARCVAVLPSRLMSSGLFDLLVMHQHDLDGKKPSANTLVVKGALNLVNKAYLDENVRALTARYQHLRNNARIKMAVLIGGDAQGVPMVEQDIKVVLHQLKSAAGELGLDLLVTTSRRTPPAIEQLVLREFNGHPRAALVIIANKSNVPEVVGGMLGLADLIVVSGESVSMVAEAASSGKRTIVFPVSPAKDHKYDRFCAMLADQGHILYTSPKGIAAAIDSAVKNKRVTQPLNDSAALVDALRKITG